MRTRNVKCCSVSLIYIPLWTSGLFISLRKDFLSFSALWEKIPSTAPRLICYQSSYFEKLIYFSSEFISPRKDWLIQLGHKPTFVINQLQSGWHTSVQFSRSVMSDSLWPHGLQHVRLPYPSPTHEACSNSCPTSQWCHPTISSSVIPFFFCLQSLPASGSFLMNQFFISGGHSIEVSASALILPVNIQDWFPLGWTGLISLQSKWVSGVFSSTKIFSFSVFSCCLLSSSHIHAWLLLSIHVSSQGQGIFSCSRLCPQYGSHSSA